MSVQCVTIGDDEVQYRIVVGEASISVGVKLLEKRTTLVDEKYVERTFERLVAIEGRSWR